MFAIGDISTADAKMAGMARMQAGLVAENIIKMVNGDHDLAPYEPYGAGDRRARSDPKAAAANSRAKKTSSTTDMVATLKGRDLMVDGYAELFGTTNPAATSSTRN